MSLLTLTFSQNNDEAQETTTAASPEIPPDPNPTTASTTAMSTTAPPASNHDVGQTPPNSNDKQTLQNIDDNRAFSIEDKVVTIHLTRATRNPNSYITPGKSVEIFPAENSVLASIVVKAPTVLSDNKFLTSILNKINKSRGQLLILMNKQLGSSLVNKANLIDETYVDLLETIQEIYILTNKIKSYFVGDRKIFESSEGCAMQVPSVTPKQSMT